MSNLDSPEQPTLAVPGVVHVSKTDAPGGGVVTVGNTAGWITPSGIRAWSQELSLIARSDLTDALREELGVTLPENRIAKSRHPHAFRAAETAPLIAVTSDLAPRLVEKGVRVHTVGFDRVTGGFMYFAEGGGAEVRVHGDLLEMIEPALAGGSSNADIERYLDRFIDRVLVHFSKGAVSELAVELANALPRLATDARGLAGVDLDAFEAEAAAYADKSKKHEEGARRLAEAVASANGKSAVPVPLFGEARATTQPPMAVMIGGSAVMLPERVLWAVTGEIREEVKPAPVAAKPEPKPAAAAPAPVSTPKPAPVAAAPVSTPKPVAATASPKPAAAAASTSKPVVTTPSPAPASAKPGSARLPTPAPGKIPSALTAKPVEAKPVESKPVESKPVESKPVESRPEATPAVMVVRPVAVVGVGEAPVAEPKSERKSEPKPEPVVEPVMPAPAVARLEPVPEPAPEPVVEAKPEPKPEPVVEAKKPEPKPEPKVAKVEEKPAKVEEKAPAKAEPAPAPAPPAKSNAMLYVIIAILVIAAVAFFAMRK